MDYTKLIAVLRDRTSHAPHLSDDTLMKSFLTYFEENRTKYFHEYKYTELIMIVNEFARAVCPKCDLIPSEDFKNMIKTPTEHCNVFWDVKGDRFVREDKTDKIMSQIEQLIIDLEDIEDNLYELEHYSNRILNYFGWYEDTKNMLKFRIKSKKGEIKYLENCLKEY